MAIKYTVASKFVAKTAEFKKAMQDAANISKSTAKKIQSNMQKTSEKFKSIGGNLTKYVTAPLSALGGIAIKSASDFSSAQQTIQNGLGLTAEESQKLIDVANNIYKEGFGQSLPQVSEAIVDVKQQLGDLANDENIEQIAKDSLALSKVIDADVNEIARASATLMKEFGISSEEAFDLMAWGTQNGLNYSDELLDNIAEYGPLFAQMGYSSEEYFNLLKSGSNEGAYSLDYINDTMKEFQIRIKDGSSTTEEAMSQLSSSTQKVWQQFLDGEATVQQVNDAVINELASMDDKVQANQIGVGLYGTRFEDMELDAVTALGNVKTEIDGLDGTMKNITTSQEASFGQRFKSTLREAKDALQPIGEIILNLAEQWLPKLSEKIEKASNWFNNLSPSGQKITVFITGMIAVLPVFIALFGSLIGIFSGLATVAGVLNIGLLPLTGIVLGIIAGVTALIAIGVLLWKNWDTIKEKATKIWGAISEFFSNFWTKTKELFSNAIESVKNFIINGFQKAKNFIGDFIDTVKNRFNKFKDGVSNIFSKIKNTISNIWSNITSTISNFVSNSVDRVKSKFTNLKNNISNIFSSVKSTVGRIWNSIKSKITNPVDSAVDTVKRLISKIKDAFDFDWSLPKLKLPHVSVTMRKNSWGIPYPDFDVSWYAKGGYFLGNNPQIVGIGEASHDEAILPLKDSVLSKIGQMIANTMDQDLLSNRFLSMMQSFNPSQMASAMQTTLEQGIKDFVNYATTKDSVNNIDRSIQINIENVHGTSREEAESFGSIVIDHIKRGGI